MKPNYAAIRELEQALGRPDGTTVPEGLYEIELKHMQHRGSYGLPRGSFDWHWVVCTLGTNDVVERGCCQFKWRAKRQAAKAVRQLRKPVRPVKVFKDERYSI